MSYEASKAKICKKLEDLKRRLGSNRGKEREFNDIIHKDFRSIFGHKVGKIPRGKKKPSLKIWIEK